MNRWMSARLTRLAGIDLPDSQCGFRLVELEPWSRMSFNAPRFEIESEMLLRFIGAHQRIAFVSIATVYGQEQSKIRPWRDSIRWFKWYFQARKEMKKIAIRPELAHDLSN